MNGVRTTCPYCGVGCGVVVANGTVTGDPDHPANFGRLCSKGAALAETLDDSRRLRRPQVQGREIEWDDALSLVAARFQDTIAEHGPDSVAFYVSGQFSTEDYYVANKLMKGFIGSANIDTNSRLCMASTVAAHVRAFGEDIVPGTYEDWEQADLVVLVGANTAWCHPVLYQRLMAARAKRGTRIIVIDPRRTATCENADLHLPLAPGTDVALFAGLLGHLADQGACDSAWIGAHTDGFEETLATARRSAKTIAHVAEITRLHPDAIATFYELFARTKRVLTVYSQGVNQSSAGTDKANAIINCHLATARIGREGMGPFSLTGQPNAMGGREVGGLANQLAAHMGFGSADVDRVRRFWNAPSVATRPGLKAVDLFDAVLDGKVKALWIAATNPAASMPRAESVRRALESCPFVVVSDCWPTDTSRFADVVLPAAGWGEKTGTVTNSERRISRQNPFRAAPGEAKPDWWMFAEIAKRMGWAHAFAFQTAEQIFDEHAALSAFENDGRRGFDIGALVGMNSAGVRAQWPAPADSGKQGGRFFADGRFFTENGRARFVPTPFRPPAAKTDRRNPFLLNTGRVRDQWHTMTRTGHVARLMTHQEEPFLEMNPRDAMKLSLEDGDLVRIETEHAWTILRAKTNAAMRQGEVFAPMHWTDDFGSPGPIARLVGGVCDPVSGQPELKATAARLAPLPTLWRGALFGAPGRPKGAGFYHARVPLAHGTVHELRGWEPLPVGVGVTAWLDQFLEKAPGTERIEEIDEERGIYRAAHLVQGRLEAVVFAARDKGWQLPDRDAVMPLIGAPFEAAARAQLFELRRAPAEASPRDRKICACFAVGRAAIEQAVVARRLTRADQVGTMLRAGTNCGSCIPEIEEILREIHATV
jgi:assimilatory nitrate reductase catalytic subunit